MNQSKYSVIKLSKIDVGTVYAEDSSGDDEYIDVDGLLWADSLDEYITDIDINSGDVSHESSLPIKLVEPEEKVETEPKKKIETKLESKPFIRVKKNKSKNKTRKKKNLQMFLDRKSNASHLKYPKRSRNSLDGIPGLARLMKNNNSLLSKG